MSHQSLSRDLDLPNDNTAEIARLIQRATKRRTRYEEHRKIRDLEKAIIFGQEALLLCPPGHPDRSSSLSNLAVDLSSRYERLGEIDDLNEAIVLDREALLLRPPGHPDRPDSLYNFAVHITSRYKRLKGIDDLNEAIVLSREALSVYPPGNPYHSSSLEHLAFHLYSRYKRLGVIDDLNEAIVFEWEVLLLRPHGHLERSASLSNLASHFFSRYEQLGGMDDLDEAIVLGRETLSLRPYGHPRRPKSLSNLALHLSFRYEKCGGIDDLNEAIILTREALTLSPPGHPHRPLSLNNLAIRLSYRYRQLGGVDDVDEAIVLARESLTHCPTGHPDRSKSLGNIANHLVYRYKQLGGIDDVNEAIVLDREALSLHPPGHHLHTTVLGNLASHLSSRYEQLGRINDLDEAIVLARQALSLSPPGHPDRPMSLNNVASRLSSRYKYLGGIDDLNEAIVLGHEALSLHHPGHPHRSASLNNHANLLFRRYNELGDSDDLKVAIDLDREALSLRPPGHPDRSISLGNLAARLSSRYEELGSVADLNEAIVLHQDALSLRPPGHPRRPGSLSGLAVHLSSRYEQLGGVDDLNDAIVLEREALSLCPPGHPHRSKSLSNLAALLSSRHEWHWGADDLNAASKDEGEMFSLYTELGHVSQTVSANDLSAAKEWTHAAEKFSHTTILLAYETALRSLVQHLVALPSLPHHFGLLKSLSSSLAVDAFSACLRRNFPTKAVELLEQGRAVFWSQLSRLRSPLDNVIELGPQGEVLADEFKRLTSLVRNTLNSFTSDQHDRVCHLNLELQKVVFKIRELPGLSRFLLPSSFSNLQGAARDGPVIIMNASDYSCDALVVLADKDPIHIPLSITKKDVREWTLQLHTLSKNAKRTDLDETNKLFKIFLRELWDKLVSNIVNVLQGTCAINSRIWWCPTAEFSLLPLHAANPYRDGQKGLSSLYVSSYTTTLAALIHARRPPISNCMTGKKRFIAVGQAAAKGVGELLHVGTELDDIGQLVDGPATFMRIEGEDAGISNVIDGLGKNEWVHLACHGLPYQKKPFESAFALHDGEFTIQHIIQCDLQNPEFAYLSACHTTVGDRKRPDEVIHLAAAMQFAGFRSVIGTMWAVDDSQTNKLISSFYKLMTDDSGRLDYTRAARALRMALHKSDMSMDQRILYVHFGA